MSRIPFPLFLLLILIFNISSSFAVDEYATIAPLARHSILLAAASNKDLTVVVGERGHILYSPDTKVWVQAKVQTRQTLTNIFMHDGQTGWAVGHDAIVLKTIDGAKTWQKVFSDINEEAPLLDIFFTDESNGLAIGAYSLMYITSDGGLSWQKKELNIIENKNINEDSESPESTDVYDLHLNAIAYAGEKRFYIAAEAGHILRSDDDGKTWQDLTSPYQGSFFGILSLSFNDVLIYGLRGHLYRTFDAGSSWQKIETSTEEMLTDAKQLSNGDIIITGLAGTLLISKDKGKTFTKVNLEHRHGLSAVLETDDGTLLLTGDAGIQTLSLDN